MKDLLVYYSYTYVCFDGLQGEKELKPLKICEERYAMAHPGITLLFIQVKHVKYNFFPCDSSISKIGSPYIGYNKMTVRDPNIDH